MQSVGKTNPFAEFLNGRTVSVGEQLTLPAELATELLSDSMARHAESVTMRLLRLESINGQAAALFETHIVGKTNEQSQPSFDCHGEVAIGIATCRTLRVAMQVNVSLTEERGPSMATFEVTNEGTVQIEMAANYEK